MAEVLPSAVMMESVPRVRFAPSPTGYLHVGGARTALFNWLFARHHQGVFILRIEDTDRERSNDAMTQVIIDGMKWVGLDWDEGPFHQADGFGRHRADAMRIMERGFAYRCFCTVKELEERRAQAGGSSEGYRYDRRCLELSAQESADRAALGETFTIRFKVPEGSTSWVDAVHDSIEVSNAEIEDFIILRSDGTPIYNLAVVSDDVEMRVTHVIRGDEHISNTPKQILIYQALGAALPIFAHVPMILGSDGKKLSKRHGATAVGDYQNEGILPNAMRNFLALLGWSPGNDREIMTAQELIESFSLEGINKKSAVFDTAKLEWMNGQYISAMSASELEPAVTRMLVQQNATLADVLQARHAWYLGVIDLVKTRARRVQDVAAQVQSYLLDEVEYEQEAVRKHWTPPAEVKPRLEALRTQFQDSEWTTAALEQELRTLGDRLGVGAGKLIHPLRVATTGTTVGPGIFDVIVTLGKDLTLRRIDAAVRALSGQHHERE
jgi:glutamyl-tRNA synthetase